MKTANKALPLILLACVLAMACESGGGGSFSEQSQNLEGYYVGSYTLPDDSENQFLMGITSHSGNKIEGSFLEGPEDEAKSFSGYVDSRFIHFTSDTDTVFEGEYAGTCMAGTYSSRKKRDLHGKWNVCKK